METKKEPSKGTPDLPLRVSIIATKVEGLPALEIRRRMVEPEMIKAVLTAAFHERPMVIQPSFNRKLEAISRLQELGIVHYDTEKKGYFFTF